MFTKRRIFFSSTICSAMFVKNSKYTFYTIKSSLKLAYETGTAMNARSSENYLAISSKSVEIFWAVIFGGRLFLGPNLVSFNRAVVPLFELSFLTREGTRLQDHLCALC